MDTPRAGFRRAAAASWALVGLGVTAVAGTSALAYSDTVRPAAVETTVLATDPTPAQVPAPVPVQVAPTPVPAAPPTPDPVVTTTDPTPSAAPQSPTEEAPAPAYRPSYTTPYAPPRSTPPTTRRNLTPSTVMAPNYSPRITMSRGS